LITKGLESGVSRNGPNLWRVITFVLRGWCTTAGKVQPAPYRSPAKFDKKDKI
jgi:hypothetical protein